MGNAPDTEINNKPKNKIETNNTDDQLKTQVQIDHNIEMNYPRNLVHDQESKKREEKDLYSFQEMIGMTYENLNRSIKEDAGQQISKLRNEVGRQYIEMNEMFQNLRKEVNEASQLKFEAERELSKIKEEIDKKKLFDLVYEDKLNIILDKHAPHNNLHIPISEVHPLYLNKNTGKHLNLKSISTMVYNKEELLDERDSSIYGIGINQMSNLANRGKTLIGNSEFIPITEGKKSEKKKIL